MVTKSVAQRIRWFAVADGERFPRNCHMRARDQVGWDATCSCGWDSRTGGAIQERIREAVQDHLALTKPTCPICGWPIVATDENCYRTELHWTPASLAAEDARRKETR